MKRIVCVLLLLPAFLFCAHALPSVDGNVQWQEYGQKPAALIPPNSESNNDVDYAYLCQYVSPEERSVYIGVRYVCKNVSVMLDAQRNGDEEELTQEQPQGMTGIEVTLNGEKCCTALFDGSVEGVDHDRYEANARFTFYDDTETDNPDTNNFDGEVRLGVKYGIPYNARLGLRILDCSGNPSNYYEILINPKPTTESAAAEKTTRAKEETRTETKQATKASAATTCAEEAATTARKAVTSNAAAQTAITLETKRPETTAAPAVIHGEKTAAQTTIREKTTTQCADNKTTPETKRSTAASRTAETVDTSAAMELVQSSNGFYVRQNTKIFGCVMTAILLTAAVMTTVFIGVQKRNTPPAEEDIPPEENTEPEEDDF